MHILQLHRKQLRIYYTETLPTVKLVFIIDQTIVLNCAQ